MNSALTAFVCLTMFDRITFAYLASLPLVAPTQIPPPNRVGLVFSDTGCVTASDFALYGGVTSDMLSRYAKLQGRPLLWHHPIRVSCKIPPTLTILVPGPWNLAFYPLFKRMDPEGLLRLSQG